MEEMCCVSTIMDEVPSCTQSEDTPGAALMVTSSFACDGAACHVATWRVARAPVKFAKMADKALVSPPFTALDLEGLRLLVSPQNKNNKEFNSRQTRRRGRNDAGAKVCLQLKVPDCPWRRDITYYLQIGSIRRGPFTHKFAEGAVGKCCYSDVDWQKDVGPDQSLKVAVEILTE